MKVTLFRDLPMEDWVSMEHYADGLAGGLNGLGWPVHQFPSPADRGSPSADDVAGRSERRRGRSLSRYAQRYVLYPLRARRHQGAVNHLIDHSYAHLLWVLDPQRTVITVHDVAPLVLPRESREWGTARLLWRTGLRALPRAARVIADSEFTARELRRLLAIRPVRVIYQGIDASYWQAKRALQSDELRARYGLPAGGFLLHVGSSKPRKNLAGLLRALATLHDRGLRLALVQAGGQPGVGLSRLIEQLGLGHRVVWLGRIPEPDLQGLYRAASVVALPSLYEGFGRPAVEAMASGTPVLASDRGALAEVLGEAALFVDPESPEAIGEGVRRLMEDGDLRARLVAAGHQRSRQFTWERCARQVVQVYEELVGRA